MSSPASYGLSLPKPKKIKTDHIPSVPVFGAAPKSRPIGNANRRKAILAQSKDFERDLDEGDDMDEKEWKVPESEINRRKRKVDEDYDEDGEDAGQEEEGDGDEDEGEQGEDGHDEGITEDEMGDGDDVEVRDRVEKKAAQRADLDSGTLQKKHRKAEGERLALRSLLDDEQGRRYDAFKVAVIPKPAIKRINQQLYDQRINDNLAVLLAGMAKIFVADIVELARDIQAKSTHPSGPLRPYHLRLARAVLEERGVLSSGNHSSGGRLAPSTKKPLFRR